MLMWLLVSRPSDALTVYLLCVTPVDPCASRPVRLRLRLRGVRCPRCRIVVRFSPFRPGWSAAAARATVLRFFLSGIRYSRFLSRSVVATPTVMLATCLRASERRDSGAPIEEADTRLGRGSQPGVDSLPSPLPPCVPHARRQRASNPSEQPSISTAHLSSPSKPCI